MNRRQLTVLGALAAVLVVAAVLAGLMKRDSQPLARTRLFPELEQRLNDVTRVDVQLNATDTLTIERNGAGWVVDERDRFPANVGQLRKVLLALARTEVVEKKTANPEYYKRLGVQDMKDASGQTRLLDVRAGDVSLARVIVGNSDAGGNSYLRRPDEAQSYLGSEWIDVPERPASWLDAVLVSIPPKRLKAVEIMEPDGQEVRIEKQDDEQLKLLQGGTELPADTTQVSLVAGALQDLSIDDVVEQPPEIDDTAWRATRYVTSDGLAIAVQTYHQEDKLYLRLTAELPGESPSEALQSEAEKLNQRFGGRTFLVASYMAGRLAPGLDSLREKQKTAQGQQAPK